MRARHKREPGTVTYVGKSIEWNTCGEITGRPLECGSIDVPIDQFDAVRSNNKTFTIPLIRLHGGDGAQNLLLNPSGPGNSGLGFIYQYSEQLSTIVGPGFHLLTFDPRGVNMSRLAATCYPNAETR